jgi:hypothetical protein
MRPLVYIVVSGSGVCCNGFLSPGVRIFESCGDIMNRVRLQHGYILMPVVLAIVLMATLAFLLNNQSAIDVDITAAETEAGQADYVAAAGMAHAIWSAQNNACGGDLSISSVPFGEDSYSATVEATGGTITTTSTTFRPDRDTWIESKRPNNIHANDPRLKVKNKASDIKYALYHFNLSPIASNKNVLAAKLWLYVEKNDVAGEITLHPLTAHWTQAGATWNSIGGSFESSEYGVIAPQPTGQVWVSVDITALAKSWINDSTINYGFLLKGASDKESKYFSRESGPNERPRLEITTADGEVSPVQITVTGTLAPGAQGVSNTRSLTRSNVTIYQPGSNTILQPGAEGMDSYVYQWTPARNYGASDKIWVENQSASAMANGLLKFDLGRIPYGARVASAVLELYQGNASLSGGPIGVHRVTRDWVEGTKNGTVGRSNWRRRYDLSPWVSPGGDYDAVSFATTVVSGTGWSAWEITGLVNGWVSGEFNNAGLALVAETFGTAAQFASSDSADPTRLPKLTISYACECNNTCLAPQGSANVLMVVADDSVLTAGETFKKALFESWGYTVNLDNDGSSAAVFETQAASNDVVYVSESVDENILGSKLTELTIGVVSEQGKLNDELGIATGANWSVGSSINVSDSSHFITRVFGSGDLVIYSAGMEQLIVSGSTAPGLQQLADSGGQGSLVLLETGAAENQLGSYSGDGIASGRRVMLPLGRDGRFNWEYLNNNGRLIVQRAIQWGAGG